MVRRGSQGEPILLEIIFLSVAWNIIRAVEVLLLPASEAVAVKCEVITLLPRVGGHDLAIALILEVTASVLRPLRVWSEVIILFIHLLGLVLMLLVQRGVAIATDPVIFVLII
jgi:hypothetical protein